MGLFSSCSEEYIEPINNGQSGTALVPQLPSLKITFEEPIEILNLEYTSLSSENQNNGKKEITLFVDLNHNRYYDKGEELPLTSPAEGIKLPEATKVVELYGNFASLIVKNEKVTDVSGSALGNLSNLSLQSGAMADDNITRIIALLPTNKSGDENSLTLDDYNLSRAHLTSAIAKGWTVKGLKGNTIAPYDDLMLLSFEGTPGTELSLNYSMLSSKGEVWFDLNDNGTREEGEIYKQDELPETLTVQLDEAGKRTIPVYGNLVYLMMEPGAEAANFSSDIRVVRSAELQQIAWGKNLGLTSADVRGAQALNKLSVSGNPLKSLQLPTEVRNLKTLELNESKITTLDLTPYTALSLLKAEKTGLTDITLPRDNDSYFRVYLNGNELTTLDLTTSPKVSQVYVNNNKLTEIKFAPEKYTAFQTLECNNNQLTNLNVNEIAVLRTLTCQNNLIETLDLNPPAGKRTILMYLDLTGNKKLKSIKAETLQNLNKVTLKDTPLYDLSTFVGSVRKNTNLWTSPQLIIEPERLTPELKTAIEGHGWRL